MDKWLKTGTLKTGANRIGSTESAATQITGDQSADDYEEMQKVQLTVLFSFGLTSTKFGTVMDFALYGLMFPNDLEAAFSNLYFWASSASSWSYSCVNFFTVAVKINISPSASCSPASGYMIGQIKLKCSTRRSASPYWMEVSSCVHFKFCSVYHQLQKESC
ncbi:hypothetical protein AVEN_186671-1 [Araneus ventricosus]|uniref:Uncharacterized protein n=1 Tax=Araneus ventricosus TaxID=182803 RepID=A0A4Y2GA28_ARAVE|nr:hypothetical protein AVEN_186671-1 [Araneus ventricosus]